ncbi:MAG: DEAD/DEAH box helicase [Treponema sp.]|jgi:superfamily II DNA/RNA helicase|nr:DEAD/DEAH box helicase [Treponema sp.]
MDDSFADLGVAPFFIERLAERAVVKPTTIQSIVMPRLIQGGNLIFSSATGTGKTFAYLIPLLQRLLETPHEDGGKPSPLMLICAPTYELCSQIKHELDFLLNPGDTRTAAGAAYGACGNGPLLAGLSLITSSLLIGSANMGRQIDALKKERPLVIVGNPGRLLQLERMGKLGLNRLRYLVLDEGDRLFQDDLLPETRELMEKLPEERFSTACSATMPAKARERLIPFMGREPSFTEADGLDILRKAIEHWAFFSEERRKIASLRSLIAALNPKKTLVFTGRGGGIGNIVSQLQYHHIAAAGISGGMDRKNRKKSLDDFRSGRVKVLVASDLASRGLDIAGIDLAAALDVPADREAYLHRAGRTGRAGKRGIMASIGDEEEMRRLALLEKKLGIVVYPKVLYRGKVIAADSQ